MKTENSITTTKPNYFQPDPNAYAKAYAAIPERLQQLDQELMVDKTKRFDMVFAVREGFKFQINVFPSMNGGFVATCEVEGKCIRYRTDTPSGSVAKMTNALGWEAARMLVSKNQNEDIDDGISAEERTAYAAFQVALMNRRTKLANSGVTA